MKHPLGDVRKITDQLTIQILTQLKNLNYLDINAMLYSAAVIINEQFKNLNNNYTRNTTKAKVP